MEFKLDKKPKNPIIVSGFPGFGLVGTIVTEFLIKHLKAKPIGHVRIPEVAPIIAVHQGEAVEPLGIFYAEKENILIIHALTNVNGLEWEIADQLITLAKNLSAKEILSVEGIGGPEVSENAELRVFYISKNKRFADIKVNKLEEGIIMGVSGALLLKEDFPISCVFAETHSALPDTRAAAKIVEVVDKYLGLKIDIKPLLKKAEEFEGKLREFLEKAEKGQASKEKKLTYFG